VWIEIDKKPEEEKKIKVTSYIEVWIEIWEVYNIFG